MEKPAIKDKSALDYIQHLEDQLAVFRKSPYVKTYLTIFNQIDNFNDQLTIGLPEKRKEIRQKMSEDGEGEIDYEVEVEFTPGKIDLFADKDSKEFDRSWKYMIESIDMNKKLDELRRLMTPAEQKHVDAETIKKNLPLAEKIALNNKPHK